MTYSQSARKYQKYFDETKQISSTGARALLVLVALLLGPKTFKEMKEFLVDCGFADAQYSIDTLRMDLNTLKAVGCDIKKATKNNDNKYSVLSHPFRLNITSLEVFYLKEAYNAITETCSTQTLLNYHYLFEKLGSIASCQSAREDLLGISLLKGINTEIVQELARDENHRNKIKLEYQSDKSKTSIYDITLEKIKPRNKKLYVFCYNHTTKKRSFLNIARIKRIISRCFDKNSEFGLDTHVKFELKRAYLYPLETNEVVLETNDDKYIIHGRYYNEFIAMQRILSFGKDCVVIEPLEFRELIIEKLLEMREVYAGIKKDEHRLL